MRNIATNPSAAAVISLILVLPLAILILVDGFEIEPLHGLLKALTTGSDGYILVMSVVLFLPAVACIVALVPIVHSVRAGNSIVGQLINLLLAVALLVLVGSIMVDQFPCWIGVPNCD